MGATVEGGRKQGGTFAFIQHLAPVLSILITAMISRTTERLGGAVLFLAGLGMFWLAWRQAAATGHFNVAGGMFAPFGVIVGGALVAMPGYRTERAMRGEDVDALKGWDALTPRWRIVMIVTLVAGLVHVLAIANGLTPAV